MSGIAAIYHRDRTPVAAGDVEPLLARLDHRGADGRRVVRHPFFVLGHQHHWATPEEVGERQPLTTHRGGCLLALDGRLDNRDELLRQLGRRSPATDPLSDACLAALAFERWGDRCFERLLGPFAIVVFDPLRRRLLCARDPMGSRTLFFHSAPRRFVLASEEWALVAHPAVDGRPDRETLDHHLALQPPPAGRTFWRGVRELAPGTLLEIGEEKVVESRFWRPSLAVRHRMAEGEAVEQFAELLRSSVASRLRARGSVSVLMSGGLDSTAVAALAAERQTLAGRQAPAAISWVFDDLTACDERRFIAPVCAALGLRSLRLPGDGGWPLRRPAAFGRNPSTPEENPYRLLKEAAYRGARQDGARVLLTGGFGDNLWAGAVWWLDGLARAGRPLAAAAELWRELALNPARALGGLRRLVGLPALRRGLPPEWLTATAPGSGRPRPGATAFEQLRVDSLLGAEGSRGATIELFHASRVGLDLRHPFRDRRLVEFALGLPAHLLYRRGLKKHLLRRALARRLPEAVLRRRQPTSLAPLYRRGILRERELVARLLERLAGSSQRVVRREWLRAAAAGGSVPPPAELALWHCLMVELWRGRWVAEAAGELRRSA